MWHIFDKDAVSLFNRARFKKVGQKHPISCKIIWKHVAYLYRNMKLCNL